MKIRLVFFMKKKMVLLIMVYLTSAKFGQLMMNPKLWIAYNKTKQGDMHECQKENLT